MSTTLTATIPLSVAEDPVQYRIVVATPPTKTSYDEGDKLATAGIVVNLEKYTAKKGVIQTTNVTSSCTFNPANNATLSSSNTAITITYTSTATGSLTTQQAITVEELLPEYNPSIWANIKSAADNGTLKNIVNLGDRFSIPVTNPSLKEGARGPYLIPFRIVHLTDNEAVFSNAGIPYQFRNTGLGYVLPDEVQNNITGNIFQASYTDVMSNFEYYSSDEKRIKLAMLNDEFRLNAQGEKYGDSWIISKTGITNPGATTTYYISGQGKFSSSGYSLAIMFDVSFKIDNT